MSDKETNLRLKRIEKLLERLLMELSEDYYPEEEMELDEIIQKRTDYMRYLA